MAGNSYLGRGGGDDHLLAVRGGGGGGRSRSGLLCRSEVDVWLYSRWDWAGLEIKIGFSFSKLKNPAHLKAGLLVRVYDAVVRGEGEKT